MQLSAHMLRIECRTTAPLALPEFTGSALRGALLGALRPMFCPDRGRVDCSPCPFGEGCPLSRLIATADVTESRGEEAPRPYVLRPIVAEKRLLDTGEMFSFGLTLIGNAASSFPYLLQGLLAMGEAGFGLRQRAPGTFQIERIVAVNPYVAAEQVAYERGRSAVYAPSLAIGPEHVRSYAGLLNADEIGLELRSPLRLVVNGTLAHHLSMPVLVRRLLRRLTDLCAHFSPAPLDADFLALLTAAEGVQLIDDATEWLDLESHSGRTGRRTPIGGIVGRVRFGGDLAPLLPYLAWLPVVGVGKDVTKGNGWIEIGRSG